MITKHFDLGWPSKRPTCGTHHVNPPQSPHVSSYWSRRQPETWPLHVPGTGTDKAHHIRVWSYMIILLMAEILHQLIGSLSHYLQGFIHPRWCRISAINSISLTTNNLMSTWGLSNWSKPWNGNHVNRPSPDLKIATWNNQLHYTLNIQQPVSFTVPKNPGVCVCVCVC